MHVVCTVLPTATECTADVRSLGAPSALLRMTSLIEMGWSGLCADQEVEGDWLSHASDVR